MTAGDLSIVVGGTSAAPTIETGTLDKIASLHAPVASVAMNSQKLTGLANGSASTDSAAFGQIPVADSTAADILPVGAAPAAGSTGKWADSGHVHASPNPVPSAFGLKAWTEDSAIANTSSSAPGTAGTVYLRAFYNPVVQTFSTLWYYIAAIGSSLTSGQCFAGVYNSSGTLVAATADQSASWASTGLKNPAFTSPYASAPVGWYYAGFFFNGSGGPEFKGPGTPVSLLNANLTGAALRAAVSSSTGNTTAMPGMITLSGSVSSGAIAPWVGVS